MRNETDRFDPIMGIFEATSALTDLREVPNQFDTPEPSLDSSLSITSKVVR